MDVLAISLIETHLISDESLENHSFCSLGGVLPIEISAISSKDLFSHPFGINPNSLSTISPPLDLYGLPSSFGNSKFTNQRLNNALPISSSVLFILRFSSILSSSDERTV